MDANGTAGRTVIVVEDDPEIRELESFLLRSEGYRVVGLEDGMDVARTVEKEHADLVLLDMLLPKRHGNDVLQDLQASPETAQVPVVVVSAYTDRLQKTPQVKSVISKPFDVTDLLDAVAGELASAG